MTKKSDSRLKKDAAKAEEARQIKEEGRKGWDELKQLSDSMMVMLTIPATFQGPLKDHALMSHLTKEEGQECAKSVRLLQADMMTMLEKFKVIRAKHEGQTGSEKDFAEVFVAYELVNEYVQWKSEYEAFILPTQGDIVQHISNAETRQMNLAAQRAAEAQAAQAQPTETAS